MTSPDLLTLAEGARILRLRTAETFARFARRHGIPLVKIGRRVVRGREGQGTDGEGVPERPGPGGRDPDQAHTEECHPEESGAGSGAEHSQSSLLQEPEPVPVLSQASVHDPRGHHSKYGLALEGR